MSTNLLVDPLRSDQPATNLEDMANVSLCSCFTGSCLTSLLQLRGLYDVLGTTRPHVANLLNGSALTHRLPPELLTKIADLAIDPGSKDHANQIIALTHACRYWRSIILSYPRMWSTIHMKLGNPAFISECLTRSQKAPLTVLAEFIDPYDHPLCRYEDSVTTALDDPDFPEVCVRHRAVLSLDQLLPHRSRIIDLSIVFHSSDPAWGDHEDDSILLYHKFFDDSLSNLRRLDFRTLHIEDERYVASAPDSLFDGHLPCLKELKYLGMCDGPMRTAKNLTSCEIGFWPSAAGPTIFTKEDLRILLDNNRTLESLTIHTCKFIGNDPDPIRATPLPDLRFLNIGCSPTTSVQIIFHSIHAPQLGDLDTVHVTFCDPSMVVRATDDSGRTLEYSQFTHDSHHHPRQYLGTHITTLRLGVGATFRGPLGAPTFSGFFGTFVAVQVLEFDGTVADRVQDLLSQSGMLPGLKVIRVKIDRASYENALRFLATASRLRMEGGKPLTAIEPRAGEGREGLDQGLRAEWDRCFSKEGIPDFLAG